MKVILLGELRGKGGEGDVVDVAQGYAENFLFPNRLALPATSGNIKQLEERRHNIEKREEKRVSDAEATKTALEGKTIHVDAKVGDEGQLFGSVTNAMVADAIEAQLGVTVDRKRIDQARAIKTAGKHEVVVELYRSIMATVNVLVGSEADKAKAEAAEAESEAEVEAAPVAEAAEGEAEVEAGESATE